MKFKKAVIQHLGFYITTFTVDSRKPFVLFVHGGPGYHCGIVDYLIEFQLLFDTLNYNIILYDQRHCGRSVIDPDHPALSHKNNVDDLHAIIHYLKHNCRFNILALMGHSYGAKVVYDLHKQYAMMTPAIFIATANSTLTPRINNLLLDLAYLKQKDPEKYAVILNDMTGLPTTLEKIWALTETLAPLFLENPERPYHYWANLACYEKVKTLQASLPLTINNQVFMSVRKDLYAPEGDYSLDILRLASPSLWVNGFHDKVMNGAEGIINPDKKLHVLLKSAHYPHIEENAVFCDLVNDFLEEYEG